jgi:hypothetical protein
MMKIAYAVLILVLAIFPMNPSCGEARGGPGGGTGGYHGGGPPGGPGGGYRGGPGGGPGSGYRGVPRGGAGGGYYGGRGGAYSGYHGRPYGGYHGGYGGYRGWHSGYRGGYGGYRGWYYGGWWYPWAVTIPFLPYYYSTLWIGGYPYYYADGTYYAPTASGYMSVDPPQDAVSNVPPPAPSAERLFVYPRQGQSVQQQEEDRYQCHGWAVGQTGHDPTQPTGIVPSVQKRADYRRAMTACLDARGYTAK